MNVLWFVLSCVFVALEVGHPGLLYFLSMSCGAFAAFLASILSYSFAFQVGIFFAMTFVCLALVHLFVKKTVFDHRGHRSNVEQLVGKEVVIVKVYSEHSGLGKVGGEKWSVKLQGQEEKLVEGMKAIVIGIQGCHLKIKMTEQN